MKRVAKHKLFSIFWICVLIAAAGCSQAPVAATPTRAPLVPTDTPTITPTNYSNPTLTPSPTRRQKSTPRSTSTPGPTQTASPTPTIGPTATPAYNTPGIYSVNQCISLTGGDGIVDQLCVVQVEVKTDGKMMFSIRQVYTNIPAGVNIVKNSDRDNLDIFLKDDLGNRYDHTRVTGDALTVLHLANNTPYNSQFEFPPALRGAKAFTFVNDTIGESVAGIQLVVFPVSWTKLKLEWYPFVFTYTADTWTPGVTSAGGAMLTLDELPTCQVQEMNTTVAQGVLMNIQNLGKITYAISQYNDTSLNVIVREYRMTGGVTGIDPSLFPMIHVIVPPDNQSQCLNAAAEVLGKLSR